jgi:hypothetical protein
MTQAKPFAGMRCKSTQERAKFSQPVLWTGKVYPCRLSVQAQDLFDASS